MNLEEIRSSLTMENLYFSECRFERSAVLESGKYHIDLSKNIEQESAHSYAVSLRISITKKDFDLLVIARANFTYSGPEDLEKEQSIIQNNTVAIMYPFIRSQVTLMTSQPGMSPIVLPPINTSLLK